jgi:hypothetical protein
MARWCSELHRRHTLADLPRHAQHRRIIQRRSKGTRLFHAEYWPFAEVDPKKQAFSQANASEANKPSEIHLHDRRYPVEYNVSGASMQKERPGDDNTSHGDRTSFATSPNLSPDASLVSSVLYR